MCHRKLHPNIQPGMIPDRGEILMMNEKNSMVQQFLLPRTELKDHLKNFIKYRAIFEEDENWQKSGFALNKEYDAGDKRNVLQRHTNTIG